eukprot:4192944-Pyramimonas_sp.AAC.1
MERAVRDQHERIQVEGPAELRAPQPEAEGRAAGEPPRAGARGDSPTAQLSVSLTSDRPPPYHTGRRPSLVDQVLGDHV